MTREDRQYDQAHESHWDKCGEYEWVHLFSPYCRMISMFEFDTLNRESAYSRAAKMPVDYGRIRIVRKARGHFYPI